MNATCRDMMLFTAAEYPIIIVVVFLLILWKPIPGEMNGPCDIASKSGWAIERVYLPSLGGIFLYLSFVISIYFFALVVVVVLFCLFFMYRFTVVFCIF